MPEQETREERWPHLVERGPVRDLKLQIAQFGLLFSSMHMFRRTATACLMQFFQQMSGIDCIVSNRHLSDSDSSPLDGLTKDFSEPDRSTMRRRSLVVSVFQARRRRCWLQEL
jgi:hypothetical protein